jgi:hypothetical protein
LLLLLWLLVEKKKSRLLPPHPSLPPHRLHLHLLLMRRLLCQLLRLPLSQRKSNFSLN